MGPEMKEPWYINIFEELDVFCKRVDEKIDKEQQQLKACKKKTEIESKLSQEMKLNNELTERLSELSRRGSELERVCATFESCLNIADSDKNRLENAKETYQLAKELTGIRFEYSAPPTVAKGYVKCESRRLLQPFEVPAAESEALWTLMQAHDTENKPRN